MSEQPRSGGLDPETLAAYVDGHLPPEERAKVEAEIAADPETYEWLVHVLRVSEAAGHAEQKPELVPAPAVVTPSDELWNLTPDGRVAVEVPQPAPALTPVPTPARVLPFFARPGVRAAIGTLLTAAAVVLVVRMQPSWWQRLTGSDVDPRMASLVAAVGEERYIEGRLTGGFKYGPLRSVTRGPGDLSNQNLALLAAAGELQKKAQEDPSAENLHAWGVAQVLLGDLDQGVASLERAQTERNPTPQLLSDLAAAYLQRASLGRDEDWSRALVAAERARALDPASTQAAYNRALSLEGLRLYSQALVAWREALDIEADTIWRREIQRKIEELDAQPDASTRQQELLDRIARFDPDAAVTIAQSFPRLAREFVEDTALPSWGRAYDADRLGARRWLTLSTTVASHLPAEGRVGLMRLLERVSVDDNPRETRKLAQAYRAYGEGRAAFIAARYADARPWFEVAIAGAGSDPLSVLAEMHVATTKYYAGHLDAAAEGLLSVQHRAVEAGLTAVTARCHWVLGIIRGAQSRFADSLGHYAAAREDYRRLREDDHVATAQQLMADAYAALGDFPEAWRSLRMALEHWATDWHPRRQINALMVGVLTARRSSMPEVQLAFQRAVDDLARIAPDPVATAEAHADAARAHAVLGDPEAARSSLAVAREALKGIADTGLRRSVEMRVVRAEALALGAFDPLLSVDRLRTIATKYEAGNEALPLVDVYLGLATSLMQVGQVDEAERVLRRGVDIIEAQRRQPPVALRVSYFDSVWGVYERLIMLYLSQQRSDEGLQIAELGRSRVMGDSAGVAPVSAHIARDAAEALRTHEAVVLFCQLPETIAVWVIRPRQPQMMVALPRDDRSVERLVRSLSAPGVADLRDDLAEVYDRLWRPLEPALAGATRLFIAADGDLGQVPFAALYNRSTSRYLVQDATLSSVPGLRFLTGDGTNPAEEPRPALVVGSTQAVGSLGVLPSAGDEADAVARVYGERSFVDALSAPDFLLRARDAGTIHFAGHAVINPVYPALSRLVLGTDPDAEVLSLHLDALRFTRRPVVVLSACSTARGAARRGEGVLSLARPFLAAGARAVVATLFDIRDDTASGIVLPLHDHLLGGRQPAEALADVQRSVLANGPASDVRHWAGFTVIESRINSPSARSQRAQVSH